jgi:hypothetical protein
MELWLNSNLKKIQIFNLKFIKIKIKILLKTVKKIFNKIIWKTIIKFTT